jgi:predicted ATPase
VRQWLLPAVYERVVSGAAEFLGELRPAYPVFVRFGGIDYDGDAAAAEKLDEFVSGAQRVLTNYGGNLLTITIGDKGAYLFGVFGTPVAHEDDAVRACAAAIELHALERTTSARDIQVGISYGRLRSGPYGSAARRTFGCVGDAVNLSARLMSKAPVGETYASEPVRNAVADAFAWRALEPMKLKGKAEPVAAFALVGTATRARQIASYRLPMVGRAEELARLEAGLDAAAAGSGRIVGISAQAGMGKSRLAAEVVQRARSLGFLVVLGECQSYGTRSAYFGWHEIWRTLFGLSPDEAPADQIARLEQALAAIDPGFVARAPLLGGLLGLSIPDNELTSSFDPKLRKTSLENLLGGCLHALGRRKPLLVVLEDCHWLDPLSRDLLDELAHATNASAVLLVLLYRPEAALPPVLGLARLPHIEQLELAALGEVEMTAVVQDRLPQLGVEGEAAAGLLELVIGRAQGNPFYAEELLNYVRAQGIDPSDERALASLDLPQSLHSLILGRIDELVEAPRRTLKVASVVGRAFRAQMLHGVYADLGSLDDIRSYLRMLGSVDLLMPDRDEDGSWLFKHAVTQEVVYESLPFALRASLHGDVGRYIEAQGPETVDRQLDLLAHHFWLSDDEPRRRLYLRRAGDAARDSYANATAIDYYERLAPLLTEGERVEVLLELGKVQEIVGDWDRARKTETDALELARRTGDERAVAWSETALAEVARKQSRYEEGAELLANAATAFDRFGEQAGLGRVLHLEGQLEAMQGNYQKALERLEQSLEIRRRLGDRKMAASVLSNLGIVAQYQGDFKLSRDLAQQALDVRVELADRWAIAISQINLGMLASLQGHNEEAQARFEEAMRLSREVGDTWAVTLCENNLGNARRNLGDYEAARRYYVRCLEARRDRDDEWALAFLLEDVAQLAALNRDPAITLELIGAADAIREEIGAPRDPALEQEIAEAIDAAVGVLSVDMQARLRARGRRLDASMAIEVALEFAGTSQSGSFPISPGAGPGSGPVARATHAGLGDHGG